MVVFQALPHPDYNWYVQCITKGTLTTAMAEVAYAAFGMVALYLLPLAVIIFSYASILAEIFRRSRDPIDGECVQVRGSRAPRKPRVCVCVLCVRTAFHQVKRV